MTWMVEFTDVLGRKHSEPANCGDACGVVCKYPDTEEGAARLAADTYRPGDKPVRIYET